MPRVEVAVPLPGIRTYTYRVPTHLLTRLGPGSRVLVPFGNRMQVGFVWGEGDLDLAEDRLKDIAAALDEQPMVSPEVGALCRWIGDYYFASPGEAMALALPAGYLKPSDPALTPTPKGLFSPADRNPVLMELLARHRLSLSYLQADPERWTLTLDLLSSGLAALEPALRAPRRAIPVFALPSVPLERLLEHCGRSAKRWRRRDNICPSTPCGWRPGRRSAARWLQASADRDGFGSAACGISSSACGLWTASAGCCGWAARW